MIELKTPEKQLFQLPSATPTRYRSLDTLTTGKDMTDENLPAPGLLQKHLSDKSSTDANDQDNKKLMCQRQSTYTLSSTPDSIRRRNKTSSPIQGPDNKILEILISAEKAAEDLRNKLSNIVKEINEDGKNDSSMCSLVLDVSKISILKGAESSKTQFASSPNLSALGSGIEDFSKSRLKRAESASTSNLVTNKPVSKDGKMSKLRRISPNIFKFKKDNPGVSKIATSQENKSSKLQHNALFKPKIVTPVRVPKVSLEPSPNLSATRKKFSHVKSTIPRPAAKKE
ncbi:unnamed protein product [Parnassius mnemosyne]|uniref:Uncharacterized protein n=1 Tax=Parnassius mnemosyne TaxID=213953 RepID=A0AAV1KUP3_9NEOP